MMRPMLVLFTSFLVSFSYAQSGVDGLTGAGSVRVHIFSGNIRGCDIQANVSLVTGAGVHITQGFTNQECEVQFVNVPAGSYHVIVSGPGIENSDSGGFYIESRIGLNLEITAKRVGDANQGYTILPAGPIVSAMDLGVPEGARKEFGRANQFVAKENWKKAIEGFQKAIAVYPQYAEAYNSLGVAYEHLGDRVRNREAFQKAVSLNDHYAPAYVNLARSAVADRDFPQAEALLDKADAIAPNDSQILALLAGAELLNQRYDQALATSRKAHSTSRGEHAVAHYIAARVFEHENRPTDALSELQVFLSEEKSGPRADAARKEMTALQPKHGATDVAQ
jgi:Flp pilus assembly protein TadD